MIASTNATTESPTKPIPANRRKRARPVARHSGPCVGSRLGELIDRDARG